MIVFTEVFLFAALSGSPIAAPELDFQGGSMLSTSSTSARSPSPGAGTPEPATMLLLAGGALGYGAYRLRRKNGGDAQKDV
jgi:hypothetical protein